MTDSFEASDEVRTTLRHAEAAELRRWQQSQDLDIDADAEASDKKAY